MAIEETVAASTELSKMDMVSIVGLIITIAGFVLAIWQIVQTRRVAEAALAAANETARSIRHIHSVAGIQEICGRSRDLLHLTRARNLTSAATAAFELRDLVSRFHATEPGRLLDTQGSWTEILKDLEGTHNRLESAAMINRLDVQERESLIHTISRLHSKFSSFAASTADSGANNANPI
jgi:hypothetical protein